MNDTPLLVAYCGLHQCIHNQGFKTGTCSAPAPIIKLRTAQNEQGLTWDCNQMAFKTHMTFIIHTETPDTQEIQNDR